MPIRIEAMPYFDQKHTEQSSKNMSYKLHFVIFISLSIQFFINLCQYIYIYIKGELGWAF